jgi:hypothetical protein
MEYSIEYSIDYIYADMICSDDLDYFGMLWANALSAEVRTLSSTPDKTLSPY